LRHPVHGDQIHKKLHYLHTKFQVTKMTMLNKGCTSRWICEYLAVTGGGSIGKCGSAHYNVVILT